MALIFESNRGSSESTLQLDVPAEQAAQTSVSSPGGDPFGDAAAETERGAASRSSVFAAESHRVPSSVITALEQASEEPLEVELARLLDAIQQSFGESSIRIAPTLRPYAYRLAGRMNIRPGSYRIRVAAPSEELAVARAEVLGRLFEPPAWSQAVSPSFPDLAFIV